MRMICIILGFFLAATSWAQPSQPPLKLLDEGVTQGTSIRELNCSGAGISCTYSNSRGTLSVTGGGPGGGATQLNELSDVNTSTPTNRNVLVADGVDWESRALTEADISDLTHTTDTNANTICSGSTTYLDGEGNCDNLSGVYEPAGITESDISDLNHTATGITDGLIVEADLNEDSGTPTDQDVLTYDSTGANFDWIGQSSIAAGTAAALAANGGNCSAGNYPLGVDASGAVETCTADDDVPESGDFTAGVDLEADGSISANSVALTTDTTGNYVSSATTSQGLLLTGTEAASLGLIDCAATEVLKRNAGDTAWECAADSTGGSPAFNAITSGTNTTAAMVVGTGGSLAVSGSGTIAATTAAALAANGGNCSAGNYPLGVDAAGAVETCTADDDTPDTDGEVPDALTIAGGTIGTSAITLSTTTSTASGRIAYNATDDRIVVGDGAAEDEFYSGPHTTDTNANTICAGSTTYLDGEGNCDNLSGVYEPAGITESDISDLNHTATAITNGIIVEPDLSTDNAAVDGDILTYDSTGTNFAWLTCAEITGSADLCDGVDAGGAETNDLEAVATNAGDAEIFVGTGAGTGAYIAGLAACAADQKIEYVPGAPDTFTCENITITQSDISDLSHVATGITDNLIVEPDLNADNAASDGDILTYDSTGTNFNWITANAGTDITADLEEDAHCAEHASADLTCSGETLLVVDDSHAHTSSTLSGIDISADTNLAVTSPVVLTGDTLSLGADTVSHTQILDADQADSKCMYIEDPVAADDLKSVWRNGTANDFQVTSIWAESDQTVTFMLQLDDGTAADCDSVDLAPAAGTAEDTSLNSDCLVSAGERLDLDIASVASTPTWVSICFTGNWVD